MTDYSNILFVLVFKITYDSVYLPESAQYIAKYSTIVICKIFKVYSSVLQNSYPKKQSGHKLSKAK